MLNCKKLAFGSINETTLHSLTHDVPKGGLRVLIIYLKNQFARNLFNNLYLQEFYPIAYSGHIRKLFFVFC